MASKDTPKIVVEKLLELTQGNLLPWQCPWMVRQPKNPLSGTRYRGINWMLLTWKMKDFDGENRFVTYNQVAAYAKQNKKTMHVKAGSKGSMIVKYGTFSTEKEVKGETKQVNIPYLQSWSVFNVTQIEGWDVPNPETTGTKALPTAEALIAKMGIKVEGGNHAAYSPSKDCLTMPPADTFSTPENHLATLIHELIHATGHSNRLNRKGMVEGYYQKYAAEEMVAEIGTSIAMAELGIQHEVALSAEYIRGWWNVIKSDPKVFIWAVSQAQKAAELVLGTQLEEATIKEDEVAVPQSYGYVG